MNRKRFSIEEIVSKLREVDVKLWQGKTVAQGCKHIGVAEQTYYKWRKAYGGMKVDQAKRLKELEKENTRLKRLIANQAIDISILKGIFQCPGAREISQPATETQSDSTCDDSFESFPKAGLYNASSTEINATVFVNGSR